MGEHHEERAAGEPLHVLVEPFQLLRAEAAQTRRLEVQDVDQANEVHALIIEALPAIAGGPFPIAGEKLLAAIGKDIVLARHVEDLAGLNAIERLGEGIEGAGLLAMGEVAGVQQKGRAGCRALILSTASCNVPSTSGLASPLNPTWVPLIWTKRNSPGAGVPAPGCPAAACPRIADDGTPPVRVQISPVPTQAMQSRNRRRGMPSVLSSSRF